MHPILGRPAQGKISLSPWLVFFFLVMQPTPGLFSCLTISAMCEETSGSALILQPPRPVSNLKPLCGELYVFVSVKIDSYLVVVLAPLSSVFGLGYWILNFALWDYMDMHSQTVDKGICLGLFVVD